jgi:hypothetical protein
MKSLWSLACVSFLLVSASAAQPDKTRSPVASGEGAFQPVATTSLEQSYIGSGRCFTCHREQGGTWSASKHAEAFKSLPEKYREDASCLKCHLTGLDQPGGYTAGMSAEAAQPFQSVGCESCHGPGAEHEAAVKRWTLAEPADEEQLLGEIKKTIVRIPTDNQCAACHTRQTHGSHPVWDGQPPQSVAASTRDVHGTNFVTPPPSHDSYSVKTCGSCHYQQYRTWRVDKHAALSAGLPVQYASDASCQKCHRKAGVSSDWYKASLEEGNNEVGVGCESCHGPALKHVLFNQQNISGFSLAAETVAAARASIRGPEPPANCVKCHLGEGHQKHPDFEKPQTSSGRN